MTDIVIEVSVGASVDVAAVADTVDVVADPGGAPVILVPTPGPLSPLTTGQVEDIADEVTEDVLAALEPPINLTLLFLNAST